jgi:hypothetical protein
MEFKFPFLHSLLTMLFKFCKESSIVAISRTIIEELQITGLKDDELYLV